MGEAMSSEAAEDDLGSYLVPALSLQTSGTPLALPPRQRAPDVECAIFWDYESIELPSQLVGAEASNRLREVALRFGRLVERRLYHDPNKSPSRLDEAARVARHGWVYAGRLPDAQ